MRKLILVMFLVPIMMMGQENESKILSLTHVKVKLGHEAQFFEGMKMYKKCYGENGGEDGWNAWRRVQGKNMVVAVSSMMDNWAAMDDDNDEASNKCRNLFNGFIMPHVDGYESSFARTMPNISNDSDNNKDKVWVTYFRVNNSTKFMDVIKTVSGAVKESEGDERAYWYGFSGGGPSSADYMVVWPFEKYADLDKDQEGVWELCEKKHGKKKTEELRETFRNSLDDSWAFMYDKSDELSFAKE